MTSTASPSRLAGRHALITGSTNGIGVQIARSMAAEGARVLITGRDRIRGEALIREIGEKAVFVLADLSAAPSELRRFAQSALAALDGRIDILVNNAAVCPATTTTALSDADLDLALAVNVRAPHVLVAELAPVMVAHGKGCVITIGSWMASVGTSIAGFYGATKAAEEQLTRSWAAEFGSRGVRFAGIAPGITRDPADGVDAGVQQMTAATPAGRPVTPADIASAAVWLASDDARFVQGVTVPVDGGIGATTPLL